MDKTLEELMNNAEQDYLADTIHLAKMLQEIEELKKLTVDGMVEFAKLRIQFLQSKEA